MKKLLATVLCLTLFFNLTAFAQAAEKKPSVEDYVGVFDSEHLCYTDLSGNFYDCDYQIPELLLDFEDAMDINYEIQSMLMPCLERSRESAENGMSIIDIGISYDAWIYEHYLTLTVENTTDWDYSAFYVCTIDLASGKRLNNADYAKYLGICQEDLNEKVRDTMLAAYDEMFDAFPKDDYYSDRRVWTCSDENIADSDLYINADGSVYLHCAIGSLAGSGSYEHLIALQQ